MAQNVNGGGRDDANQKTAGQDAARETPDDAALRARLDTLSNRLAARHQNAGASGQSEADLSSDSSLGKAMNLGFRVLAEFVAAVGVGTLIGWQLDAWFHTGPILLIVFLMFGTAAGFLNIYRLAVGPTGSKRG
jgi:ATP synthase protein I